ncbi:MAG: MAPEG family protein [Pseudomonadales bacterium]|nr:MAPEG family protein [Pseudomonadales bacterium]
MELLSIISMLALMEFVYFGMRVGMARGKYSVQAPATTGNEIFERYYRVHYNTLEQLVIFLPSLWAFGHYIGEPWAAGLGMVFIVGRVVYSVTYIKNPASRTVGTLLSMIPCWIMMVGALIGAVVQYFA